MTGEYGPQARPPYLLPGVGAIFDAPQMPYETGDASRANVLEEALASFGVGAKVTHVERGPSITRYHVRPERGVRIARITALHDELAVALAAQAIDFEAPIPGTSEIGIDVPNATVPVVTIREILERLPEHAGPLYVAFGKDIIGGAVFGDLARMPHLLIAGATGTGKSACANCIIASLLVTATPDQVELLLLDTKRVELTAYNGIPHLTRDVVTDPVMAAAALALMTREMDLRYERFAMAGTRTIEEYNAKFSDEKLPHTVIVIDEVADLMLVAPAKVEASITRLARDGRATGMHLVITTSRLSADVVTPLVKSSMSARIAFKVTSHVESQAILGVDGAQHLRGRGDMLYFPIGARKPIRLQGALVTGREIDKLVAFWKRQPKPSGTKAVGITSLWDDDERSSDDRKFDDLCYDAAKFLLDSRVARGDPGVGSTAALQARFTIGHPRAVRLMRHLEELGIVGPIEGTKPRNVMIASPADLDRLAERFGGPAQTDGFSR